MPPPEPDHRGRPVLAGSGIAAARRARLTSSRSDRCQFDAVQGVSLDLAARAGRKAKSQPDGALTVFQRRAGAPAGTSPPRSPSWPSGAAADAVAADGIATLDRRPGHLGRPTCGRVAAFLAESASRRRRCSRCSGCDFQATSALAQACDRTAPGSTIPAAAEVRTTPTSPQPRPRSLADLARPRANCWQLSRPSTAARPRGILRTGDSSWPPDPQHRAGPGQAGSPMTRS